MPERVFVDANVLASRTLRDWLFLIRNYSHMYSLHSTLDVLAETIRVVRHRHPNAGGGVTLRLRNKLTENLDELCSDFPPAPDFHGIDVDDQHVHAAAVACHATILLTNNTKDFGDPDSLPYDLYTADEFFCLADGSSPWHVREVTHTQNTYWLGERDKGRAAKPLAVALVKAGCPKFAIRVAQHLAQLSGLLPGEEAVTVVSCRGV